MLEWFKQQPVDKDGKLILPKAFSGESEVKADELDPAIQLELLRAMLANNMASTSEDYWDEMDDGQ